MKRLTLGIAAFASVAAALGFARSARSADHLDSPATKADPTVDIDDVYAFMDGTNAVFAMTVFPAATTAAKFSDHVQYVFHTASAASYGPTSASKDIICTFDTAQTIQCWVGTDEYVSGDASQAAGVASADGKVKVFAGLRADPFFFNLDGFHHAEATVEGAAGLAFDNAGCPLLDNGTAAALRTQLTTSLDGGTAEDFFKPLNGLAIVVQLDKTLVAPAASPLVSVWAATYRTP